MRSVVCYSPLQGYRAIEPNEKGKRPIVFSKRAGFEDRPVSLPCGQCVGCRLERSRVWATRCVHEASLHDENCFITLTYNDANLPEHGSLVKADFQKFMKRLRERVGYRRVRYYMCGEYGENFGRPHYHACLFGFDFMDKVPWRKSPNGDLIFRSALLEELWPFGFSSIGSVTWESAAYVARYVMKKRTGAQAREHYDEIDPQTGEVLRERIPEYNDMSRRPGIGRAWFDAYYRDIFPWDFVVHDARKFRVPRFYDNLLEKQNPEEMLEIKRLRVLRGKKHAENNTKARLKVRETVQLAKLDRLKREDI